MNVHSVLARALRTFVQAFVAGVLAAGPLSLTHLGTAKVAIVAAIAAGVAAVMRLLDPAPIPTLPAD